MRKINRKKYWLLPIRILLLLPFFLVASLGEWAEKAGLYIDNCWFCPEGLDSDDF